MDSKRAPSIQIRPLGSQVVVRVIEKPPYSGNIIVISQEQQPATRGEVLSVGPEVKNVIRGDRVLFSRLQGYELNIGEPVILIREAAILATI